MRLRRIMSLVARSAGAILFLLWVFTRMADFKQTLQVISGASIGVAAVALGCALAGELTTAYKWVLLVRVSGGMLPFYQAVRASFIGMFYNNFLPGNVGGDLARVLVIRPWAGSKAAAAAATFMQRATGLGGLLLVAICAASLWPFQIKQWRAWGPASWPITWFLVTAIGYVFACLVLFNGKIYHLTWKAGMAEERENFPSIMHRIVHSLLVRVRRLHHELHAHNPAAPGPLLISVITQLFDTLFVFLLALSLGIQAPFYVFLSAVPLISLASLLPITLNGIGLREAAYISMLASAGVAPEAAAGLSLLQFAVILLFSATGAAFTLTTKQQE